MCPRCSTSDGRTSRRSVSPHSSAPARMRAGESAPPEPALRSDAPGGREHLGAAPPRRGRAPVQAQQCRPPAKPTREQPAQGGRVGVRRRDESLGVEPRELEHPPARVKRAARLVVAEPHELTLHWSRRVPQHASRERRRGLVVLKAVLRDRVAQTPSFREPAGHRRAALAQRMQVAGGDHQQRDAMHAVIVQPVADQRAALERRRLDVVQRDRDPPVARQRRRRRRRARGASCIHDKHVSPPAPAACNQVETFL